MTRRKPGWERRWFLIDLRHPPTLLSLPLGVWSTGLSAYTPTVARVSTTVHEAASRWESQRSFDELGRPLRDLTFTVVDLETTGGSAEAGCMITEIGAVKVRGGEVLGEFQTLVNPHTQIPPFIAVLTGISNAMVADAPPIESALPAFLEFAAGTILVAHNAPFDVGFLKHFNELAGPGLAGVRGRRHRQAGAPGDHPRRRTQLQALLAGAGVPVHHHAQPPRPLRRAGHRRRAARADGAARRPRGAHPRGAPDVLRTGVDRPAPQAPPRRGAAALPRRLPVLRRRPPGPLRRHLARPAHPGALLLHRVRDPVPDGRDGRARDHRRGHRLQHRARGPGPRAAADRRAQAALQPALPVPRADALRRS